ncbi:MAG: DegT/DnrJ/EryC1/StrS family aminotransferase [Actinomycetota bacterium]|nr:DegT/DnrJ/EryC1/StrS family aminotransferase [Actinomycetota bacterium]
MRWDEDVTAMPDEHHEPIGFSVPHIDDSDIEAVVGVLRGGWLTTGSECAAFERELQDYLDVPHAVGLSSCTAAIETAFAYLGLPAGAQVGVPTWTFPASAFAPVRHGAVPVLVDLDPDTLNVSAKALEAAIASGIDAFVAVHFAGIPLSREVHDILQSARVPVIEDAAHAFGAVDHRGRVAGQDSVAACFSFYATKNLTSGEGGALVTEDADLADFARSFRLHGLVGDAWSRYRTGSAALPEVVTPGIKGNLPDLLAALARSQLRRFDDLQKVRREIVLHYRSRLSHMEGVRAVPTDHMDGSADHLMVVVLDEHIDRERVIARLSSAGIGSSVHFRPLHHLQWFRRHAVLAGDELPVADALAPRALSLPLHARLEPPQVDRVCDVLASALS